MTFLVLIILLIIWAAVLLPPWIQNRRERRPANSIRSFRNQLSVLERRAAATTSGSHITRAGTRRTHSARVGEDVGETDDLGDEGAVLGTERRGRASRSTMASRGRAGKRRRARRAEAARQRQTEFGDARGDSPTERAYAYRRMSRAEARRRRRDIFLTLFGAVVLTFGLAVVLGRSVWLLHLGVDVVFAAYVMLLIHLQRQAEERAMKVRHLHDRRVGGQSVHATEPALLLRRSVN